jgi:hypothetical protein
MTISLAIMPHHIEDRFPIPWNKSFVTAFAAQWSFRQKKKHRRGNAVL